MSHPSVTSGTARAATVAGGAHSRTGKPPSPMQRTETDGTSSGDLAALDSGLTLRVLQLSNIVEIPIV